KTVHHYLMRFLGGELSDDDLEVAEVAWVPMHELPSRLAYADERRLAEVADELIDKLQSDGPAALPPLPPSSPRRRPQTHSRARHSDKPAGRKNRSEEHTSELQSLTNLVCRLLLEKKNNNLTAITDGRPEVPEERLSHAESRREVEIKAKHASTSV